MALKSIFLLLLVTYGHGNPIDTIDEVFNPRADDPEYRLPEGAVEVFNYNIELNLGIDVFETTEFEGVTYVEFNVMEESNEIKLHANRMNFSEVSLWLQSGTELTVEYNLNEVTDILTVTSTGNFAVDRYMFRFNYTGVLRTDSLNGLYRSSYVAADGSKKFLATTQFQPTHARKVFPCFDEPRYKARFDIKITHGSDLTALGNTAGSRTVSGDLASTTFGTTPVMSTYLIAFVISDFTCTSSEDLYEGIPHGVCSREDSASTRELAVDVGPKLVRAMGNFTGVSFELHKINKIQEVAIPDFSAGAMENWGLVTYRETALLWDPAESSNRYKQNVVTIMAHELAHFWFGDFVTCQWWSVTFLNEGFATYFEFFLTAEVEPAWEMDKQFVLLEMLPVLVSDASPNAAALNSPASSPSQISGRFGSITYSKGGCIFRMVEHFMGLDNFKLGLNKYLIDHEFSSVTPADLWAALQNFVPSSLPDTLDTVMENWVDKGGYPVLTVSAFGRTVQISQKRFLSSGTPNEDEKWYVPVSYTTSSDSDKFQDTEPRFWLLPDQSYNITNGLATENDWIILNNQETGYYRVDYDDQLWTNIKTGLNRAGFDGIHEINRAQLVDDFYIYARYGLKSFAELLDLVRFLKRDTSYAPWYAAFTAFNYMVPRIGNTELRIALHDYILNLVEVLYNSIPFNDARPDDQIYTHKKVLVIPWACRLGLQECIDSALGAYANYKNTQVKPDKNLRSVIYCNGVRHSTNIQNDWDFLWQEYTSSALATEQATIISALGCATDESVLKNFLNKSIDATSGIRQQDALSVFSAVYGGNPEGVDVAFDFLIENYDSIVSYYETMNSVSSLFSGLGSRFTRQDQADKFENFINNHELGENLLAAQSALRTARLNLEWISKFEEELKLFFTPESETTEEPTEGPTDEPTDPPGDGDGTGTAAPLEVGFATAIMTFVALIYQVLA